MPQLSDIVAGSLCFTVGAAGLYYLAKRIRDGMRNADAILTSDLEHTKPVDSSSLNPSLQSAADGFSVEDSLAEAKKKYEQALKTNTWMERKASRLKKKLTVLQEELSVTRTTCKDLSREQEQQQRIRAKAEKKFKKLLASNAQLKKEKSDLLSQIQALRESEWEANSNPSEIKSNLAETTTESLADVEKENPVLLTTDEELKKENSDLRQLVATLQDSLREHEEELSETKGTCYELTWDLESEIEAHDNLKSEVNQMKEKHAELLKEREREQVSLAEAERKCKEAMDSVAKLEIGNSDLMSQMETLQGSVQQLKQQLSEA